MTEYTRDELLDFAQDFDDLAVPEQATTENERDTPTGDPHNTALPASSGGRTATSAVAGRHRFLTSGNPRTTSCARCGRPPSSPAHDWSPDVDNDDATAALERALKSLREGNRHYAQQETAFALRVLRGEK